MPDSIRTKLASSRARSVQKANLKHQQVARLIANALNVQQAGFHPQRDGRAIVLHAVVVDTKVIQDKLFAREMDVKVASIIAKLHRQLQVRALIVLRVSILQVVN